MPALPDQNVHSLVDGAKRHFQRETVSNTDIRDVQSLLSRAHYAGDIAKVPVGGLQVHELTRVSVRRAGTDRLSITPRQVLSAMSAFIDYTIRRESRGR